MISRRMDGEVMRISMEGRVTYEEKNGVKGKRRRMEGEGMRKLMGGEGMRRLGEGEEI